MCIRDSNTSLVQPPGEVADRKALVVQVLLEPQIYTMHSRKLGMLGALLAALLFATSLAATSDTPGAVPSCCDTMSLFTANHVG